MKCNVFGPLVDSCANHLAISFHCSPDTSFWLGKGTVKYWKRFINEQIEEQQQELNKLSKSPVKLPNGSVSPKANGDVNDDGPAGTGSGDSADNLSTSMEGGAEKKSVKFQEPPKTKDEKSKEKKEDDDDWRFNEDLLCDEHSKKIIRIVLTLG